MNLGTLGPVDVISAINDDVVTEQTFLTSIQGIYSLDEFTPSAGMGPILVGVAHSDYSATEIEAWVENTGSWEEGDLVQTREIGRRLIRKVGVFENPTAVGEALVLNDGKPIKTKCNWRLATGQSIQFWAYNMGSVALAATDPQVKMEGHANLWPN